MEDGKLKFCGTESRVVRGGGIARWDNTPWDGSKWQGDPRPCRLTLHGPDSLKSNILWAYDQWAQVAALEFEWTSDPTRASLLYTYGPIDGESNTLAWNQLPYGPDRQLEGRVDSGERWHLDPHTAPSGGRVHLGAVLCHEGGHGLGLEHDNARNVVALLDPMYNPRILKPQPADIEQVQLRYGPPITSPTPDSGDPEPGQIVIDVSGTIAAGRYQLVKQ